MYMSRKKWGFLILFVSVVNLVFAQLDPAQQVNHNTRNNEKQKDKPYVILISVDGFRYDYAEKYQAQHILDLSKQGVRAASLIPGYPSVTFPNHYSIVTGLYPAHHGIVSNHFYDKRSGSYYAMWDKETVLDGSWYGGTPLWVLAEQQEMLAANLMWVGSEADIQGRKASYYYPFNDEMPVLDRIQAVKSWLSLPEDRRPHLMSFYLSDVDHAGHRYGPDAPETRVAVQRVDSIINALTEEVQATGLPINFILVGDHGMTAVDQENPIPLPASLDTSQFKVVSSGTQVELHAKQARDIKAQYVLLKEEAKNKDYDVLLKTEMPAYLHYGISDDYMDRIGDILLLPHWPKVFAEKRPGAGYHGFNPIKVHDMHSIFYAWGPAFKSSVQLPSFENVHVYPLIAEILGLEISQAIDGDADVLLPVLRK